MRTDIHQHAVLIAMRPRVFYRAIDLAEKDRPADAVRHALVRLERGGIVDGMRQRGLPHKVWITRQSDFDF